MSNKTFKIKLTEDWKIQSSEHISQNGKEISTNTKLSTNWLPAKVPSTILGTLVANQIYKDPYFGENLKNIPTEQFEVPWWYTTSFQISKDQADLNASFNFDGINYKANVWLNGNLIADSKTINGAYRITSFDASAATIEGENVLAIEIIPPKPGDFSTGFVDWNPAPPDGNMGIFRNVTLHLFEGIEIKNPFVQSKVDLENLNKASLTVSAELQNTTSAAISGILVGKIENIQFEQKVTIGANCSILIEYDPAAYPQLNVDNPRLWWPVHLGNPDLYKLEFQFIINDNISDTIEVNFGIREVEDYWINDIHRGYKINGKKVLIKGAGWTDDLLLMDTDENIEAQVKYVKQMNLNTIRLEGFWGKDHKLYDLCDEHGILLMVGWSCHWEHEIHMGVPVNERFGGVYKPEDIDHVAQAWEDQLIWLRNHPSIFVWTVASDKVPITELEQKYIDTFAKYDPTRPYLNSTGGVGSDQHVIGSEDVISEISGSSGVKMLGPYAYTAPVYWFTDTNFGGAYGFNTETGPGAQVPQLESLKKFIPEDKLWPISDVWNYHCGRYEFADLSRFVTAINERYGSPSNIEDFDKKAQAMNYELMRPMFEAFQVHKDRSTGIIQWMLNAAWPKMYWQLYDYYLMPTGAFYATQKACSPLHLVYNYGDHKIYAINDYSHIVENLRARVRIYDIEANLYVDKTIKFNISEDTFHSLYEIEDLDNLSTTYFIDLRLIDDTNKEIDTNFYWLSTKEETLDYEADLGEFAYHTPSKIYADFTLLNTLNKVDIAVDYNFAQIEDEQQMTVTLKNTGDAIAFLINLKLEDKNNREPILPIFWEDNFISLLPGEKRTLHATFKYNAEVELKVEAWNSNKITYGEISN
ncbi:glycoside hydrolase family 2 TIM barrel-domain containing protein [uncultured Maribacter sp.]|mgnify:CR=1 FL=1|uniref:glycoside hydrolase family 2 protein n=1 Tax=uncultured Maribacter sp. TaxID=431308 RepID=UPI0030EE12B2|tara:strand:- start:11391 stop:13994 length:2604 start_codon:yes stop_codon:yes gene_type:complete